MKFEDLLDVTLGEILEEYSIAYNNECGFLYGVIPNDIIRIVNETYNLEEYDEAFVIEPFIDIELLTDMENEVLDMDRIGKIMKNLGITTKKTVTLKYE